MDTSASPISSSRFPSRTSCRRTAPTCGSTTSPTPGITEDRYLKAVEAKPGPGARAVVHHLLTYLIQDVDEDEVLAGRLDDRPTNNESFLNEYAVGKNGDILPDGTAKLVKAGSKIRFNLHYHPSGKETMDRARVGLKFYPKGYKPKYHQISLQIANAHEELDIPPNT